MEPFYQSKINKEISNLCDMCNIPEDVNHYLFVCQKFDAERIKLQEKVEEIITNALVPEPAFS